MPVDRLTHIRHNWQEKGNGPRGRDVDFLLGLVDEHKRALLDVEWKGRRPPDQGGKRCCPWCGCEPSLHGEDCRFGAALHD